MRSSTSIRSLLAGHRFRLAIIGLAAFIGGLCEALFLVIITRAAFAISNGRDSFGVVAGRDLTVGQVVAVAAALVCARVAFSLVGGWASADLTARVTSSVRHDVAHAYLSADWTTQHDDAGGELQDLLTSFTISATSVVSAVGGLITSALNLAGLMLLAVLVDPAAAVVTIVAVALLAAVIRPIRQSVRRASMASADAGIRYAAAVSEISALGLEMNVFDTHGAVGERVDRLVVERAQIEKSVGWRVALVPTVYSALAYLAILLALLIAAAADQADLRSVGAVMLVMLRSLSYGQALQGSLTTIAGSRPYVEEIGRRIDRYLAAPRPSGAREISRVGVLELREVTFSYDGLHQVLRDVTARFEPGEIVGLVGPSGAGKSTLVQLLLGLRSPDEGAVVADGRSIEDVARTQWARLVTFVPQQPRLVAGSIAENIRFYRSDVTDADIDRAAIRAHLGPDLAGWVDGIHHDVGAGGSKLSGGQQQRVCIARALVENPDVFILDEPTSALDADSELAIRATLAELRGHVTVIVIAHRPSTLEVCDRIVTLGQA